ncbi:MAG: hypothetical protein OJF51_004885 [Nitrospira sp.]|nr:MAG: hypothetical protein OJF51_004885 [Nitrospira sp.]
MDKVIRKSLSAFAPIIVTTMAYAGEAKIHNIEYPSHLYGKGGVVTTVESDKPKVECVAYRDGVPVGSGSGYTTAGIANVTILITEKQGTLMVKCG